MSRPSRIDLDRANDSEIRRSESVYRLPLQFENIDENCNFVSFVDFTGCSGTAKIFDKDKVEIGAMTVAFRPNGWCDLTHANPSLLPLTRQGSYQLLITYGNGDRLCEAEGNVEVIE